MGCPRSLASPWKGLAARRLTQRAAQAEHSHHEFNNLTPIAEGIQRIALRVMAASFLALGPTCEALPPAKRHRLLRAIAESDELSPFQSE